MSLETKLLVSGDNLPLAERLLKSVGGLRIEKMITEVVHEAKEPRVCSGTCSNCIYFDYKAERVKWGHCAKYDYNINGKTELCVGGKERC